MPVSLQVAHGDLCDRLTILRVKRARIKQPASLAEIDAVLDVTNKTFEELLAIAGPEVPQLVDKLEQINAQLWDLENCIRNTLSEQGCCAAVAELSKQIIEVNAQRAATKRQIDVLTDSEFVEIKRYAAECELAGRVSKLQATDVTAADE